VEIFRFDETYITKLQKRDPETEAHLVAHFKSPVWLKARYQLRATDLADDACQETFLRVLRFFRSGKRLEDPARLPAFVYSVCHNVTLEMIRSKDRYRQIPENYEEAVDTRVGPEEVLVTEERKQVVREILDQLSKKDRELLRQALLDEVDRAELCRRFGVTPENLRVLLHRARVRFRDALMKSRAAVQHGSSIEMK
jgi:RNA polymerase sigma-70 factor (ECF subfamily)